MWKEYFPTMKMWKDDNMPCAFTPIFTGHLRGVYYGKLWAQMLARDMAAELAEAEARGLGADFGAELRSKVHPTPLPDLDSHLMLFRCWRWAGGGRSGSSSRG